MARIIIKLSLGATAALAGLLMVAAPALAYVVGAASSGTAPAAVAGGVPFTFTAHFVQPSGAIFPAGVSVTFSQESGPAGCVATFSPVVTTTDSSGTASSTVTLPVGCPGTYVLLATVPSDIGSVSVTVTETSAVSAQQVAPSVTQPGVFPNTTALPPGSSGLPWVSPAVEFGGGAALLIALVGFMYWRQRRSTREA